MAFTYSPDLADDVSRVRFWLRDTAAGAGPLPDDANFQDEELTELVALEGGWRTAVAAGFEALAAAWLRHPSFTSGDLSISRSDIAKGFQAQADTWRQRYGAGGLSAATVRVGSFVKTDQYSEASRGGEYARTDPATL